MIRQTKIRKFMNIIGELKDKKMAEELRDELRREGIVTSMHYQTDLDLYVLMTEQEDKLSLAQEHFRVRMGFKKPIEIDEEWVKIKTVPRGDTTSVILIICVVIYVLSFSALGDALYRFFMIGEVESNLLAEVRRGQLWRLFTPALLHMSFIHILFNMLWFKDLGNMMEYNFGNRFLLVFIAISAMSSNIMQYFVAGPQFGGMSGVLYGMLGFIWAYKNIHQDFVYSLPKRDLNMMIGWYFLCLSGLIGPIANTAHGMGLVAGLLVAVFHQFKWENVRIKYFMIALFFFAFTLAIEGFKLKWNYFFNINQW